MEFYNWKTIHRAGVNMSSRTLVVSGTYGGSGTSGKKRKSNESSNVCESNQAGDSGAANVYCIVLCEFYFTGLVLVTTCA